MIETVKASDLVKDPAVYPREQVSQANVLDIARALKLGRMLPPPIVDKNSLTILDGYHRVDAYQKQLGDDIEIEVEVEDHPDKQSMLLRSIELNVTHGQKFFHMIGFDPLRKQRISGLKESLPSMRSA